jgi:hypothetical protein
MKEFRVTAMDESTCTVCFEPWGNEYELHHPDFLVIAPDPKGGLDEIVYRDRFIQLFFAREPRAIRNSRGESVSA